MYLTQHVHSLHRANKNLIKLLSESPPSSPTTATTTATPTTATTTTTTTTVDRRRYILATNVSIATENTRAIYLAGEMLHQHLVTIINSRTQPGVLHRCSLIPTLSIYFPRLRTSLCTWFIEMLSPHPNGFFQQQRNMVGLVLRECKIYVPYLGARVCEFLWPLQRFCSLNEHATSTATVIETDQHFFNVRKYFSNMNVQNKREKLINLLKHFVLSNEFIDFTMETVLGELLTIWESNQTDMEVLKHGCILATNIINRDDHDQESNSLPLSSLSRSNIKKLQNTVSPMASNDLRGVIGFNIRYVL